MWTVFSHTKLDGSRELGIQKKARGSQAIRRVMFVLKKGQKATEDQLTELAMAADAENKKIPKRRKSKSYDRTSPGR
jgi:hypothetical protein